MPPFPPPPTSGEAAAPRLTWSRASGGDELRLEGLADADLRRLRTLPAEALAREMPVFASELLAAAGGTGVAPVMAHRLAPMDGEYRCDDAGVAFTPRRRLLRGRSYSAVVGDHELTVRVPAAEGAAPTVVAIHPTGAVVPRNLLRCYVEFSAPMSGGDAARSVTVADADGTAIPGALLDMDPELWDPRRTRLTVLLDPARIKRGLAPHREAGYALREGGRVELVVGMGMRDRRGLPLAAEARRAYSVGSDVRTRVDPREWRLDPVVAGTRRPLTVSFGRTLDHALLDRCLVVVDERRRVVAGSPRAAREDTAWAFVPAEPWTSVGHQLVVDPTLEDVCGNSVTRVFDRDLSDPAHEREPDHPALLPFTPA